MNGSSPSRPGGGPRHRIPPLTTGARTEQLPLSFAQQRLWFIGQVEPGNVSYNVCFVFELRGALNAGALGDALQDIVRRHEVLRTWFPEVLGQAQQVIAPALEVPFEVERVEDGPDAVRDRARREAL